MSDVAVAEPEGITFSKLVHEAFIDPIRSVLIVDDRYPTWEQVFKKGAYSPEASDDWEPASAIAEVLQQFRNKSPALTVDIHDGECNDEIGSYLYQSDLLVLDFQLGEEKIPGGRAAQIVFDLLNNNHFNLIIVHTALGDLITPLYRVLAPLIMPLELNDKIQKKGLALVEAAEDLEDPIAVDEIKAALQFPVYAEYHRRQADGRNQDWFIENSAEMASFLDIANRANWRKDERRAVMDWGASFHIPEDLVRDTLPRGVGWSVPEKGEPGWIRANGGFVAFADKEDKDLLAILQGALEHWNPTPSRLISSRIRAEISARGVAAEDYALSDVRAHWQYYQELRRPPSEAAHFGSRDAMLEGHAARHTERLLDLIGKSIVEYGKKIIVADPATKNPEHPGFSANYNVDVSTEEARTAALAHYNAHISTKPVSGWHLQPGHVIRVRDEKWVCLSPACDLVPKQKTKVAVANSKDAGVKPFVAVKIYPVECYDRADVNSNSMVFLREGGAVKAYTIQPTEKRKSDDYARGEVDGTRELVFPIKNGSPTWRLFMASDNGVFDLRGEPEVEIQLSFLCGKRGKMEVKNQKATIVAQLRYEYALNLIQKLGVESTRVGLDFSAPV